MVMGSIWLHLASRAELRSGVCALTRRFTGTPWFDMPGVGGATSVTFGSSPRNAERRNLNAPVPTSFSVQARMADFWSLRWSGCCLEAGHRFQRPCRWPCSASAPMLTTMSTSGTATPKAAPLAGLAFAKPLTWTSGASCETVRFTRPAMCATA
eukprot:CAMPEP_0175776148 /NCGR_PEP_ID=MMETSP0097-20121207/74491_1 /TAXON_ID=311494 /ORGANISM="Alexandrium monilatum, Strain CCMP3105" /LENGTH=153 /DNA_ID=CAMNT_0017086675 /DNA_START=94 /DNA_END=551 /DNA_ORIENTATION=-